MVKNHTSHYKPVWRVYNTILLAYYMYSYTFIHQSYKWHITPILLYSYTALQQSYSLTFKHIPEKQSIWLYSLGHCPPRHLAGKCGTVFARIVDCWIPASYLAPVRGVGEAALRRGLRRPPTAPGGNTRSRSRNYKKETSLSKIQKKQV